MSATLEWQAFGESPIAHLVDTDRARTRWTGVKALCGRYVGRNFHAWWALPVAECPDPLPGSLRKCPDCVAKDGASS